MHLRWLQGVGNAIASAILLYTNHAVAQIAPDTSLPNNTQVNAVGTTTNITGGTQAGTNLFHSFKEFSIPTGNTVFFNNTVDIQNIISRVTGESISNIDGLIRANGTANLFLINPNGIVFGSNARLDIGGSFIGSTANSLKFADGTEFGTNPDKTSPLLTISVPLGLQFGTNSGAIALQGVGHEYDYQSDIVDRINADERGLLLDAKNPGLEVREGKTLALVGGNVSVDGAILKAPAGRVEIASVGSNSSVSLNQVSTGWKVSSDRTSTTFADIQVANKSWIGTTGIGGGEIALTGKNIRSTSESILRADTTGNINGGGISIVGDSIEINKSNLGSYTFGAGNGGSILLDAKSIKFGSNSGIFTETQSPELIAGKAGDITFKGDSMMTHQSQVRSNSFSAGNAGQININANSLYSEESGFGANVFAKGNSQDISIAVGEFKFSNGGIGTIVFTNGSGNTGKINITADSFEFTNAGIDVGTQANSTGDAGAIFLNVSNLMTVKNAGISAMSEGTGNGGKISINANQLQIENAGVVTNTKTKYQTGEIDIITDSFTFNNTVITNTSDGTANGGKINIQANFFTIQEGGVISTATNSIGKAADININVKDLFSIQKDAGAIYAGSSGAGNGGTINISAGDFQIVSAGGISAKSEGLGNGGKISINANKLQIESSPISTNTNNTDQSGEIDINVTDSFTLKNTGITNTSDGDCNGGKISIAANSFTIDGGQAIKTDTNSTGKAGDIIINVKDSFIIQNTDPINTSSFGRGNGGIINISAGNFYIKNATGIISQTQSAGTGGDININVKDKFDIQNTAINASSSGTGNAGRINISAKNFNAMSTGIISETQGAATGGDININVKDKFDIQNGGGVSAIASGTGGSGRINIMTGNFQIDNGEILRACLKSFGRI